MPNDFVDRRQYLHARQTLLRLIELGCIPIINENDAIASHELRYGDNDRIAALVAHNVNADLLVLLTDTPGLFTADPRTRCERRADQRGAGRRPAADRRRWCHGIRSGQRWHGVEACRSEDGVVVRDASGHRVGRSGRTCWSTPQPGVLVGTTFQPSGRRLAARKLWIGFASQVDGVVSVDDGARRALGRAWHVAAAGRRHRRRRHLRRGRRRRGARHDRTQLVARGMVLSDAATLRGMIGKRTSDLPSHVAHEVIHRDDLVLLT